MTLENGWTHGPSRENGSRWQASELGAVLRELVAEAPAPEPVYGT